MLHSLFALLAAGNALEPARSDYLLALTPNESFVVVTASDIAGIRKAMEKNSWFRFAQDEQVVALVRYFAKAAGDELHGGLELDGLQELGLDPQAIANSLAGSAVFFAQAPSNDPDDILLGLLYEVGEDRAAFDEVFGTFIAAARSEAQVTASEYGGAALTVIEPPAEGMGHTEEGIAFIAELGNVVAFVGGADRGLARACIESVVDRWSGSVDGANLLANENYRAARRSQAFAPQMEVFFDFGRFWDLAVATGELEHTGLPAQLGEELERIRWMHAGARIGEDESWDLRFAANVPNEGILGALANLFGNVPAALLRRVPRQATNLSAMSVDFAGLAALVGDLVREFDPSSYEALQAQLGVVGEQGVGLGEDVLALLTGELACFTVEVPAKESVLGPLGGMLRGMSGGAALPTHGTAFLVGIRDPVRVRELLSPFAQAPIADPTAPDAIESDSLGEGTPPDAGGAVATPAVETFNGFELHSAQLYEGMVPLGIHWSVTHDALVVALQPTAVREALRMFGEGAPGILENRRFGAVIEENKQALALQIWNSADTLKAGLGLLQTAAAGLRFYASMSDDARMDGFPIGKDTPWPQASVVDAYFEGIVFSAIRWRDGALELHVASR